jgi:hypothetical protein
VKPAQLEILCEKLVRKKREIRLFYSPICMKSAKTGENKQSEKVNYICISVYFTLNI